VRTSRESLFADVCDSSQKDGINMGPSSTANNPNESETSSNNKPSKRVRKDDNVVDGLVGAIDCGSETLVSLAARCHQGSGRS
jgi:hypothetical protein